MKKTTILFAFLFFLGGIASAQYTEDFESYSGERDNADCFVWSAFALSNSTSNGAFDGFAARSNQLSMTSGNSFFRTPALNFTENTNIVFEHRVQNTSSTPMLTLVAIDVDNTSETPLAGPISVTSTRTTATVPSTLQGLYRLEFRTTGAGSTGQSRINVDNISIDGATLAEFKGEDGCEVVFPEDLDVAPVDLPAFSTTKLVFLFSIVLVIGTIAVRRFV